MLLIQFAQLELLEDVEPCYLGVMTYALRLTMRDAESLQTSKRVLAAETEQSRNRLKDLPPFASLCCPIMRCWLMQHHTKHSDAQIYGAQTSFLMWEGMTLCLTESFQDCVSEVAAEHEYISFGNVSSERENVSPHMQPAATWTCFFWSCLLWTWTCFFSFTAGCNAKTFILKMFLLFYSWLQGLRLAMSMHQPGGAYVRELLEVPAPSALARNSCMLSPACICSRLVSCACSNDLIQNN